MLINADLQSALVNQINKSFDFIYLILYHKMCESYKFFLELRNEYSFIAA